MTVVRYREENGKISRKHGNTLIQTLRNTYGTSFAPGCADHAKLSDVLAKFDELSLGQLIRDHEAGKLEQILPLRLQVGPVAKAPIFNNF